LNCANKLAAYEGRFRGEESWSGRGVPDVKSGIHGSFDWNSAGKFFIAAWRFIDAVAQRRLAGTPL